MNDPRLGTAYRALRRRKNWRQRDLAAAVGVSQQFISKLECGHVGDVSVDELRAVASALDSTLALDMRWHGGGLDRLLDEQHAVVLGSTASMLTGSRLAYRRRSNVLALWRTRFDRHHGVARGDPGPTCRRDQERVGVDRGDTAQAGRKGAARAGRRPGAVARPTFGCRPDARAAVYHDRAPAGRPTLRCAGRGFAAPQRKPPLVASATGRPGERAPLPCIYHGRWC